MNLTALYRILFLFLALSPVAAADVVTDVRTAIARNDFGSASGMLSSYRAQHGTDPQYLEALSWMGRGELGAGDLDQAYKYAVETQKLTLDTLRTVKVDDNPHVALALGAAFEVQAQVLSKQNRTPEAVLLLRNALAKYGNTSIHARLQKNLNLITLLGKPAPSLAATEYLGEKPRALADLKGSVVLLFFWAHWCGDCKAEAPVIAQLQSDFQHDLIVVAPTQRYGYAGARDYISPSEETSYIESVRQRYYSQLSRVAMPISKTNFDLYGASTTPTLVLLGRDGRVALYHPGAMPYGELRSEIEKLIAAQQHHARSASGR